MSKKAEIIKKDVMLITKKEINHFNKKVGIINEVSLNIEEFKECRLFRGTHSIKKEPWTYYCKNEGYYSCFMYCFIIDLTQKEKALEDFFNCQENKYKKDIEVAEINIERLRAKIKYNKFLTNETLLKNKLTLF